MTRVHHLKTWPAPFEAAWSGAKHHEVRPDDRGFAVGDTLVLKEYDPSPCGPLDYRAALKIARGYTGREITARVTYKSEGGTWSLPRGLCVLSIEVVSRDGGPS